MRAIEMERQCVSERGNKKNARKLSERREPKKHAYIGNEHYKSANKINERTIEWLM